MPNVTPTHLHELQGGRHLDILLEIPLLGPCPLLQPYHTDRITDLLLSLNLRNSAQRCENTGLWEEMVVPGVHNRDKGTDIRLYLTPRTPHSFFQSFSTHPSCPLLISPFGYFWDYFEIIQNANLYRYLEPIVRKYSIICPILQLLNTLFFSFFFLDGES